MDALGWYCVRLRFTFSPTFSLTVDPVKPPAWKRLINPTLTPDERISLIMAIFSDPKEVEMVRNLSGDDAQTFIDLVDGVRYSNLSLLKHE